jgi:hypothetical protein
MRNGGSRTEMGRMGVVMGYGRSRRKYGSIIEEVII